ncbi:MAG: hypothetical protein EXS32_07985 [Opitutus sp.]|nr:hypothetical protein [Opitutus sp.]
MSLINEALKKAQRVRTGDPGTMAPMPGGSGPIAKLGQPRSSQQLLVLASGAVVLVVLSAVGTIFFVNRTPEPKAAAKLILTKSAVTDAATPAPVIVAPVIAPAAAIVTLENPPAPRETYPAPVAAATMPAVTPTITPTPPAVSAPELSRLVTPAPPAITTPIAAAPLPTEPAALAPALVTAAPGPPVPDARIHTFVDGIHVTGIRSSGADSKVLMNGRVFRVNDIVERTLGVRLTKVEPDTLTFTDANGAVYVKNF